MKQAQYNEYGNPEEVIEVLRAEPKILEALLNSNQAAEKERDRQMDEVKANGLLAPQGQSGERQHGTADS